MKFACCSIQGLPWCAAAAASARPGSPTGAEHVKVEEEAIQLLILAMCTLGGVLPAYLHVAAPCCIQWYMIYDVLCVMLVGAIVDTCVHSTDMHIGARLIMTRWAFLG